MRDHAGGQRSRTPLTARRRHITPVKSPSSIEPAQPGTAPGLWLPDPRPRPRHRVWTGQPTREAAHTAQAGGALESGPLLVRHLVQVAHCRIERRLGVTPQIVRNEGVDEHP
jgi:hypothetical protein